MNNRALRAILESEKKAGHEISKEEILEHIKNLEKARVNHLALVEKEAGHDPYKHGNQIIRYVKEIAKDFGCTPEETELIACAAKFHDIGKTRISNEILDKPGSLTSEEYEDIKMHTVYGQELMSPLSRIANLIRHHHERYDGKGYPDGLSGKDIPLGARIISAIDAFNAMTHQRSYNKPIGVEQAIEKLKEQSGKQFDPDVVSSFISILNSVWLKKNIDFVDG